MLRILASTFLALCVCSGSFAQTHRITDANSNLWISHWGDHRFHDRWSFHTEGHWRRTDLGEHWQQLLLRPAINFHLNDQVLITQGYSYYINHTYSTYPIRFQNWEHHLWQQIQLTQAIGRVRIQHRFRMEERFIARLNADADEPSRAVFDSYGYQNRFRYRVWVTVPLGGHEKVAPGVFSVNLYDEVFLNFGDPTRLDHINQNRISALLGYQVNKELNALVGYLHQTIQRPGAAAGIDLLELNSTIHLALVYNMDLRKAKAPTTP
ncbi:MAG: DUF2490 domain-containing protein [Flavobacteriales bacterium]|nr:DUF2490 domain-containing protein [Flavobacteriales bacterium]